MMILNNPILPPSYSFALLNLCTLLLIYAKITVDLYVRWSIVLFPTIFFIVIEIVISLKDLFFLETHEIKLSISEIKLILTNKLANIILGTISIIFFLFLSEYFDYIDYVPDPKPEFETLHLFVLVFLFLSSYLAYSILLKKLVEKEKELTINNETINVISIAINSLFSILGNTMTICSTGACNSIYISTISAFFSAFGITIVDWLPYIRYSALIFIIISVFSMYSAKKSFLYGPFIMSFIASIMIFMNLMLFENSYLLYIGNILIIFAAFRNARMNTAGFGKKTKAQV